MGEQFYTELHIGGNMKFDQVLGILDFIPNLISPYPHPPYSRPFITDYVEENLDFADHKEVKEQLQEFNGKSPIKLVDHAYPSGDLDELKEQLEKEGIPFVLRTAGTNVYHPELAVFRPDDDLPSGQNIHTYQITFDNHVLVPWEYLYPSVKLDKVSPLFPSDKSLDLPAFYCRELDHSSIQDSFQIRTEGVRGTDEPTVYHAWCDELGKGACCGQGSTEEEAVQDYINNVEDYVKQLMEMSRKAIRQYWKT